MLCKLHTARRIPAVLPNIRRCLATEVSGTIEESEEQQRERYESFLAAKEKEPPTRPQLDVQVNPEHGLYAFFRKVSSEGGLSFEYDTVQSAEKAGTKMGRSWNATELRRKSFKDLHTLWYIVLRERNLLATQAAEAKRLGINDGHLDTGEKDKRCRKTMARIKTILNERRLAYEQAYSMEYERYKAKEERSAATKQSTETGSADESISSLNEASTRGRRLRRSKRSPAASLSAQSPVDGVAEPPVAPTAPAPAA
ncbi:hypothetical protein ACEPAG_1766 [Sanghuangporus baumii]